MINLTTYFTVIKVSGQDAKKFLQGQLTCNVDALTSGAGCFGAHCTPQGRVICLFYLFLLNDTYYLYLTPEIAPNALKALKKYAIFSKSELMILEQPDYLLLGTFNHDEIYPLASFRFPSPTPRYLNLVEHKQHFSTITDWATWEEYNFQDEIPTIYATTSGKFLPHELNLPALKAVNFDKGCYTGQEIIARMEYRGKLKTHLYRSSLHTVHPPAPGDLIFYQTENTSTPCGSIVTVMQYKTGIYHILFIADEKQVRNKHLFLTHEPNNYLIILT